MKATEIEYLLVSRETPRHLPQWFYDELVATIFSQPGLVEVSDKGAWLLNISGRYHLLRP